MKPNLFHYATSELSQDAFLCWLLAWAEHKHGEESPALHRLGTEFLNSIFKKVKKDCPRQFDSINVTQQDGGIDILCEINNEIALIIEDKVGTKEHSDQLARYKTHVMKKGYSPDKILSVYLQTGDQSDYTGVLKHGYVVYERIDLLTVLESSGGIEAQKVSDVFQEYSAYLRGIEDSVQSYRVLHPKEWSWDSWKGFYSALRVALEDGQWDYVANPSGGFLGFWWHFIGNNSCEQYLQLEQEKFCFKIWVKDPEKRRELRGHWHDKIMDSCSKHQLKAKRPDRFGNGEYMTVAVLDQEYRAIDDKGILDMKSTIDILRKAETVLNDM